MVLGGFIKSFDAFTGPTRKTLDSRISQWTVVAFKSIPNPHFLMLPNDVFEDLSTDHYYRYKICFSVICGEVDEDMRLLEIEPVVHSRWVALACRVLCLYTATDNPL